MAKPFECGTCNKCCFGLTIHLTLADLDRMAQYLGVDPGECLEKYVVPIEPSDDEPLFTFRKGEGGRCFHMDDQDRCGIHPAKPWVCQTYHCAQDPGFEKGDVGIEWGTVYNNVEGHADLQQMIHARTVTTTYITRNGSNYNPADYAVCMADLAALLGGTQDDRIKVAKDDEGQTVAMTYNCNKCTARENCCNHAAATLDDIAKAAHACKQTVAAFWDAHVSDEPNPLDVNTFTFKQSSDGKCEFLDPATHRCGLGGDQPSNCAFSPCPKLSTAKTFEQYFIGSGSVHDQFRLQVATSVTRQYLSQCGTSFNERFFERCMGMIEELSSNPEYYSDFLEAVRAHRYINEDDELNVVAEPALKR